MTRKLLFFILPLVLAANVLRAQGVPSTKLSQLELSQTVDTTKAGQFGLTNSSGVQRYAQYTKINPTPIAYTPAATGNPSANYSQFVQDPGGDEWYIDYNGRAVQLTGGGSTCDVDWLQISDNSCPDAITDSIYKQKYVSIGARYVWPTAELLVSDSAAVGTQVISGFRNARFVLYDNLNQNYSTLDQGGSSTIWYFEPSAELVWKTATAGTPAAPAGTLVNHVRFNMADSTVQWYQYPNTRVDTQSPVNFLYTDVSGIMRSKPVGSFPIVDSTTASNGLTKTLNDIKLGGLLTQNTTITGNNKDLIFDGVNKSSILTDVDVDGNTNLLSVGEDGGTGISLNTSNTLGKGAQILIKTNGVGATQPYIRMTANNNAGSASEFFLEHNQLLHNGGPIYQKLLTASTATVQEVMRLSQETSGTSAAGFGGSLNFYNETDNTSSRITNSLTSKLTTAADATYASQFILGGVTNATAQDILTMSGAGALKLNKYGIGTFTGTPAYTLQVDASGNVIEGSASAGITGSGATDRVTVWSGTSTVTSDTGFVYNTTTKALSVNNSFAVGGAKLTVNGRIQTIGGIGVFQGTGAAQSSSNAAGIRLVNSTASTGDTWTEESANGGNWNIYNGGSGTPRATIDATGQFGLGLTTPTAKIQTVQSVAATTTVTDNCIFDVNSTGTAGTGFGQGILFRGESSTTDNRDMARVTASWATATDASRQSKIGFQLVSNAGTLAEHASIAMSGSNVATLTIGLSSGVAISPASLTSAQSFTVGNSSSALTLGGSSGTVTMSSSASNAAAISLNASGSASNSVGGINFGGANSYAQTSGTRNYVNHDAGFAPTSGTAVHNSFVFSGTFNQTGGANGVCRALYLNQTLTAVADFRGIEIAYSNASAKGLYQTGSLTTNNLVGKTGFGATTAPSEAVDITGNLSLTTAGNKIKIATGSNASIGTATLVAGTVTVNTTAVATGSIIMVSCNTPAGTQGILSAPVASITNATSFIINSSNAADTSTVNWWIVN